MNLNIDTSDLHAHVHPVFWPVLWLNLFLLRRWYDRQGDQIAGISYVATRCGVIRIERIFPRRGEDQHWLDLYENLTETWCFDQLGHCAQMFARANRVEPWEVCGLLSACVAAGFAPSPAINDSS